jgi:hypothetical protein
MALGGNLGLPRSIQVFAARRGRPLCLPFFKAAAWAIRMGGNAGSTQSTPGRFAATPARGGHKTQDRRYLTCIKVNA